MIGIGIASSLGVNLSGLNPATRSFVTSAGISDPNTVLAVNNLINGLQADGLWPKMKAIYPFATDNRNLSPYSEDYTSNANWGRSNVTTTANTIISPNGTLTASTATTTANANNALYNANPVATSTNQTFTNSIYLKYNNAQWVTLELWNGGAQNGVRLWVDIQNGVLGTANATIGSYTSSSITNVGNGWYRVSVTGVMPNASAVYLSIRHVDGNGAYNFTAVNGKSTYIWGAQSEVGTLTSYQYIPTTQQAYISNQFKYNLKDPRDVDAAYRLVFNGGWTHSSTGATPNGTNAWGDTKLPNNTMSQNSMTMCTYLRTNTASALAIGDLAVWNALFGSCIYANQAGNFRATNNGTNFQQVASADSLGFFLNKRINSTQITLQKNATLTTFSSASQNLLASNFIISRTGDFAGEYSNRQTAFVGIGDGLTDTESANLYTRVQAFQTELSRQV